MIETAIDHPDEVTRVRYNPHQPNQLASFLNSGDINLYNLDNGEVLTTFKGHTKEGYGMCFSESHFISGSGDNRIILWDVTKGVSRNEL